MTEDQEIRLKPLRGNPFEEGEHGWELHAQCEELHAKLPWTHMPRELSEAARSGFVFSMSLCQASLRCASIMDLMEMAYPRGSQACPEIEVFNALRQAGKSLGCHRWDFLDIGMRAIELAPAMLGGSEWADDADLSRAARLCFCQCVADSCASRLFRDGRSLSRPPKSALAEFSQALALALRADWPDACVLSPLTSARFGAGDPKDWPPAIAALRRISDKERAGIEIECQPARSDGAGKGRL